MAQWSRALTALTEDLGSVPSIHKEVLDPGMNPSSGLSDNRHVYDYTCIHAEKNT